MKPAPLPVFDADERRLDDASGDAVERECAREIAAEADRAATGRNDIRRRATRPSRSHVKVLLWDEM